MESSSSKKKQRVIEEDKDNISELSDDVIHRILSFLDAKQAVQTSVLSKRWKLVWTTLPFLSFGRYDSLPFDDVSRYTMLIRHVLSNRNHQSHLSKLDIYVPQKLTVKQSVSKKKFRGCVVEKFIQYAISHNVQELHISTICRNSKINPFKLSTFNSDSMKKLTLDLLPDKDFALESNCWDLPSLTTLHLRHVHRYPVKPNVPESWLACLPALRTLILDFLDLSEMHFSLPNLTTLCLKGSELPQRVWDLPALFSLHLESVKLPKNMSDMFSNLVNLKHLTLLLSRESSNRNHFISCPQLRNLNIIGDLYYDQGKIVVSAPQLCNFSSFGIFLIKVEAPELENVNIRLKGWFRYASRVEVKNYYQQFTRMLSGLATAKNISFDLESIEALSEVINIQASVISPFINLKYVKLPKEYKESSLSSALRSYLLDGCRGATVVTTSAQNNRILRTRAVSAAAENVGLQEPLAASTKELDDCQYLNRTVTVEYVDVGAQEQHVMENSLVDANRAGHTNPLVIGVSNDQVSSSKGNRDFGLWQGHEVNSDFVCLLNRIMNKYPETFEHFTTKNKKISTVRLNMLCTSLNDFSKVSKAEVDSEIIVQYRDIFFYLQSLGFNLSWVLSHLDYIEHMWFSNPLITEIQAIDCRIDDAKSEVKDLQARVGNAMDKLQNLQAPSAEKITEIEKKYGTSGTNLAVGFIGDDLLSGP